jgi:hypothetical protein
LPEIQDILLFLHFVGLILGAGGGLGSTIVMRHSYSLPEDQASVVRGTGPELATVALAGVVLLLVTGVGLLAMKYNFALDAMSWAFWVKLAFVTTLTFASIMIHAAYRKMKAGDASGFARAARFGPVAGISAMLATLFAVLTFH